MTIDRCSFGVACFHVTLTIKLRLRLPFPLPQKNEKERKDYSRNASCTIHHVILLHFGVSDPYEEYLVYSDATNVDPVLISYYHYNVFDGC
jgi:hypothetical protein